MCDPVSPTPDEMLCEYILNNDAKSALEIIRKGECKYDYFYLDSSRINNKYTPLILACMKNMTEVSLALIATGKSMPKHVTQYTKTTALILACTWNNEKVILALIATGESNLGHCGECNGILKKTALDMMIILNPKIALTLIATGECNLNDPNVLKTAHKYKEYQVIYILWTKDVTLSHLYCNDKSFTQYIDFVTQSCWNDSNFNSIRFDNNDLHDGIMNSLRSRKLLVQHSARIIKDALKRNAYGPGSKVYYASMANFKNLVANSA